MSYEKIKEEFIKSAEAYINAKRQPFEKLSGIELVNAKSHYLDNYQDYITHLNFTLNALIEEHSISFQTLEEANAFQDYIKPTFEILGRKFTEGLID
ncbi:hypothetical protein EYY60_00910 [Flavobacterium zhairuonense]|uniref:hypothetical protein n=1 Tax=Flavobacterium zhairuonense TaxID=2493631 RepID=UPI001048209C|nr:hypothetical protein [Flavobacterium zhairuonense]KAF2516768.1 hypothetical protein EYY60_00910 [Flavobacterium zhairuonense]